MESYFSVIMPRVPPQQQQKSTNMEELKKGAWSPEEDKKLRAYIMKYGIWNWSQMPKFAGLSTKNIIESFQIISIQYVLSNDSFSDFYLHKTT